MSILDHIEERRTGMRHISDFQSSPVERLTCESTGAYAMRPDANEEFILKANIAVKFWANKAQYNDARKLAEQVLLQRLYGDTIMLLREARKAVMDGDAPAVLDVLGQIESNLTR